MKKIYCDICHNEASSSCNLCRPMIVIRVNGGIRDIMGNPVWEEPRHPSFKPPNMASREICSEVERWAQGEKWEWARVTVRQDICHKCLSSMDFFLAKITTDKNPSPFGD